MSWRQQMPKRDNFSCQKRSIGFLGVLHCFILWWNYFRTKKLLVSPLKIQQVFDGLHSTIFFIIEGLLGLAKVPLISAAKSAFPCRTHLSLIICSASKICLCFPLSVLRLLAIWKLMTSKSRKKSLCRVIFLCSNINNNRIYLKNI